MPDRSRRVLDGQGLGARVEELERGGDGIRGGQQVRIAELRSGEGGRVPERAFGPRRPRADVYVRLGVIVVPWRGAVVGALAGALGPGLDRDVEVLGPEVDLRRRGVGREAVPKPLQRLVAAGVEVRESI